MSISEGSIETAFPLTPLQEGLLLYTSRHPNSSVYRGQVTAELEGAMDHGRFQDAWNEVARRHEAFRSFFAWEGRDRPLQVVRKHVELPWRFIDWSGETETEQERLWATVIEEDRGTPFQLSSSPVMRFVLVHLGSRRHRLLWTLHHALADGWSSQRALNEVMEVYARLGGTALIDSGGQERARVAEPRPAPPSFATFVGWLQARDREAAERFWRPRLAGVRDATPLPGARDRSSGTQRAKVDLQLGAASMSRLRRAASRMRVTPNTIAVGAWAIVLDRFSEGTEDVTFGCTIAERPTEIARVEEAVGLYLNTVPIRVPVPGGAGCGDWLADLQCNLSDCREHSVGGLAEIRRWSDIEPGGALAHSVVVYESFPEDLTPGVEGEGLRILGTRISAPAELPLSLLVYPGEELRLDLEYDTGLYTLEEASRLVHAVASALRGLTEPGDGTLDEIDIVGSETRDLLAQEWSGVGLPVPEVRDVLALFEQHAIETPQAVAVHDHERSVTYEELDAAANRLAHRILEEAPASDHLLAVPAEPAVATIVSILAALKASRGYTVFDPHQPKRRLASVLSHVHAVLDPSSETDWGVPTIAGDGGTGRSETKPDVVPDPGAVAYVVWTSGSTGEPKGVVVERDQLARSTAARLAHYGEAPPVFLMLSSLAVDSSVAGLYWALCTGGCLVLAARRAEQDLDGLAALIHSRAVSTTLLVPSLYRALLDEIDPRRLASLQSVVVAGEACPPSLVTAHRSALSSARLFNEYGPSEATVWATVADLTDDVMQDRVAIGRPVPFVHLYLLDAHDRLAPIGAPGEICLAGTTLARGYLGDAELTAERFGSNPFSEGGRLYRTGDRGRFLPDGRVEFLGRVDDQIKVRGFRVEPAEIESALTTHPAVQEAMIVSGIAGPPSHDVETLVRALSKRSEDFVERLLLSVEVQ